MDTAKITFLLVFLVFGFINFWLSIYSSRKVLLPEKRRIPLVNPFWFLYRGIFEKENKYVCYIGGVFQLTMLFLVIWGFPKFIFQ